MEIEALLPIGSIVRLTDAQRCLMIFGIKQSGETDNGTVKSDYIGVLYPEGNMGSEFQYLFNHGDIEEILFRGFEDSRRDEFISRLSEYYVERKEV